MASSVLTVTSLEKRVAQLKPTKENEKTEQSSNVNRGGEGHDAKHIDELKSIAADIITMFKTGKAATAEQKTSLYNMLGNAVPAHKDYSANIATTVCNRLSSETQEACVRSATLAIEKHLAFCLAEDDTTTAAAASKVFAKEMGSAKIPTRKAVCSAVGEVIWSQPIIEPSSASKSFIEALIPALEGNLKNASQKTLTSPSGPLEGYVAAAVLLGRAAKWEIAKVDAAIKKNEILQTIAATQPKPSFLLNDKVVRKVSVVEEEVWLLRALDGLLLSNAAAVLKDSSAIDVVALAIRQIAFSSKTVKARNESVLTIQSIAKRDVSMATLILKQGLTNWLMTLEIDQVHATEGNEPNSIEKQDAAAAAAAERPKEKDFSRAIKKLMASICSVSSSFDDRSKMNTLCEFFVLAHHPELGVGRRQTFIGLCQVAKMDTRLIVDLRLESLLASAKQSLNMPQLRQAALDALSTLVLIAPQDVSAVLMDDIRTGLGLKEVDALTPQDLGIWQTPPDSLFVDVLSQKDKSNVSASKGSAMDKWDAEMREAIAKKKGNAAASNKALTKEQQSAVNTQKQIEREVRQRVIETQTRLRNALAIVVSLVEARTHAIDDKMVELVSMLLAFFKSPPARQLALNEAHRAFDSLSTCCGERMDEYGGLIKFAILRTIDPSLVPAQHSEESMKDLALRILYRLRFLCEQAPLDLASISFVEPFISKVILSNGLDLAADDEDGTLEQVQLALDFITFHGEACRDSRFPRLAFIDDLAHIVANNTQLAKDAVSALRTLGDAIKINASPQEISRLLHHILAEEVYVRTGALQALQPLDLTDFEFCSELWLTCHDEDEENARLANKAWEENGLDIPMEYASSMLPMLQHSHNFVRSAAARSIATAAQIHPETTSPTTQALMALYEERNQILETEYDRFGMPIEETVNREDPWRIRDAIASSFLNLAPIFQDEDLVPFFNFLIGKEALGDRHERVRKTMLDAATAVTDQHGSARLSELIAMFENFLQHPQPNTNDDITEAVIILFGRLAKHLTVKDPRVSQVIERLVEALKTPSELVQVAVADCLVPLARTAEKDVPALMERLFDALLNAPKYGERRGAAYGIAGLVKGRGISSIAEFNIMTRLAEAVEDKKGTHARQGAMMVYETLMAMLQRLFEPYIPQILPQMLSCFGDGTTDVRDATQETARVMMQNISGYGVRLIMPSLLEGLEDKQWRTKKGAIELLGAMAYCAPKQLSHFLPTVIPNLNEPIKDSHKQVRLAAETALKGFGDVISNPEVKKLVPVIMKALVDPAKTPAAQRAMLTQKWIHVLDGPSLALLVPVIDRGLRERGAQIQKDAARIVGNLASLTDSKDFVPYLNTLVPLVRQVLVSPVPDARATAAKSLGTLVERLGEIHFVDLVPSLLQILKSDLSSVDRQGSAQGLAEVLAGLGVERMEALLPDVINNAQSSSRSSVRESHILLLIFLPATFGLRFTPYLGRIIPPILGGIADEADSVREASMRAGRMIIANYSSRAVDLLLPELEQGLFDESWRIRLSSVQLIADLLFRLAGITGNNEVENDDEAGEDGAEQNVVAANSIQKTLADTLGTQRRDQLIAKMYVLRQDVVVNVRQAAIQLWKTIISNTPKVVREILPLLIDLMVDLLAREDESKEMSGRALGELVSKLGERILAECIPMLRMRGVSEDVQSRIGVCYAVTEVLNNASEDQAQDHQDSLIAIVRQALSDPSSSVREAAAEAFDSLHEQLGDYATEEIVPGLIETLLNGDDDEDDDDDEEEEDDDEEGEEEKKEDVEAKQAEEDVEKDDDEEEEEGDDDDDDDDDDESEEDDSSQGRALSALQEIMRSNAESVFPVVVPELIEQPITAFKASALATLAAQAGNALNSELETILSALLTAIEGCQGDDEEEETKLSLEESFSTLLSNIYDSDAVYEFMDVLLGWAADKSSAEQRLRGTRTFSTFCRVKDEDADMGIYGIYWVQRLVALFNDTNEEVVDLAVNGLEALIKIVPKEDLDNIVVPLYETLIATGQHGDQLPGFMRPKGAAPLSAVFLAGLMNGTAEQRELGALGLAEIILRSSAESIKPLIISIIGPLIRSCGDRHLPAVKKAILYALTTALQFPQHCKPFFPQLQRSFQKAIQDAPSTAEEAIRKQAEAGLELLMSHQARGFKPA
ncbi:ARM repeat-containing protein [Meira miltonrushii]|uniref:eIF-2-alpha kinase activator GCN1 n=1 Tax=Meira miltonrushii TaxID=1280837 RepID=A0A316VE16_9BASI|nr:ARM repeat-containing protein [Meira miltonrushii]PWN35796.1 ARM repeat-containing protein [Meira miltonrushii]